MARRLPTLSIRILHYVVFEIALHGCSGKSKLLIPFDRAEEADWSFKAVMPNEYEITYATGSMYTVQVLRVYTLEGLLSIDPNASLIC